MDTGADLTGAADGFSAYVINDSTKEKTEITGDFVESSDSQGLYFSPMTTIDEVGDYTIVIENSDIGMDSHAAPVVVVAANIDDVKAAIDEVKVVADTIAADVDGLDGQSLQDIKDTLEAIKKLGNDTTDVLLTVSGDETSKITEGTEITGDTSGATSTVTKVTYDSDNDVTLVNASGTVGTFEVDETLSNGSESTEGKTTDVVINTVNSIIEYVERLNDALSGDGDALDLIKSYTDDVENMLLGSEKLADGSDNPLYGSDNTVLKGLLESLSTSLSDAKDSLESTINDGKDAILSKIADVQTVVDNNKSKLEDDGYGLSALKDLLDTITSDISNAKTDILGILEDDTKGLVSVFDTMVSRFDSVDAQLEALDDKIESIGKQTSVRVF